MIGRLRGGRIYLDANVFIYAIEGFAKYVALSNEILQAVEQSAVHAITSELTLAEVLVHPIKQQSDTTKAYEEILEGGPSFDVLPVSRKLLRSSARVRAEVGGRLPDAIHRATALEASCNFLVTADRTMKVMGDLKLITLDELLDEQGT